MNSQVRVLRLEPRSFNYGSPGYESFPGTASEDCSFISDHQVKGREESRSEVKPVMPRLSHLPQVGWGPAWTLISFGYLPHLEAAV